MLVIMVLDSKNYFTCKIYEFSCEGYLNLVKLLYEKGANLNSVNKDEHTALDYVSNVTKGEYFNSANNSSDQKIIFSKICKTIATKKGDS